MARYDAAFSRCDGTPLRPNVDSVIEIGESEMNSIVLAALADDHRRELTIEAAASRQVRQARAARGARSAVRALAKEQRQARRHDPSHGGWRRLGPRRVYRTWQSAVA